MGYLRENLQKYPNKSAGNPQKSKKKVQENFETATQQSSKKKVPKFGEKKVSANIKGGKSKVVTCKRNEG